MKICSKRHVIYVQYTRGKKHFWFTFKSICTEESSSCEITEIENEGTFKSLRTIIAIQKGNKLSHCSITDLFSSFLRLQTHNSPWETGSLDRSTSKVVAEFPTLTGKIWQQKSHGYSSSATPRRRRWRHVVVEESQAACACSHSRDPHVTVMTSARLAICLRYCVAISRRSLRPYHFFYSASTSSLSPEQPRRLQFLDDLARNPFANKSPHPSPGLIPANASFPAEKGSICKKWAEKERHHWWWRCNNTCLSLSLSLVQGAERCESFRKERDGKIDFICTSAAKGGFVFIAVVGGSRDLKRFLSLMHPVKSFRWCCERWARTLSVYEPSAKFHVQLSDVNSLYARLMK